MWMSRSQGQAWFRFRQRKNGNEGAFPITQVEYERVLALVPARYGRGEPLFTEHFRKNASGTWAAACVRVGVEVFTPHGVRRLMDDKMCRRGVELKTYEILMDHSAETALKNYRRATRDDLVAALPKLRSTGDPLARWLSKRGMTEDDALSLLRSAVGEVEEVPELRVVE
jgi:integrase